MLKDAFHIATRFGGLVIMVLYSSFAYAGGLGDYLVRFSTNGPDRYSDGTLVGDGECYALVWSPKGFVFSGFNADGTTVSSADRVVLAAPLALDGRCRDSLFQISAEEYAELAGGEWAVCLVDTRLANGVPAGVAANVPRRVNRWGLVEEAGVKIEPASVSALTAVARPQAAKRLMLADEDEADDEGGARAANLSAVPATAKSPKISSFTVDNGVARLTVDDTEPYLTYGIASGETPSALNADGDAGIADGKPGAAIEFEADASGGSRFFKVVRAE